MRLKDEGEDLEMKKSDQGGIESERRRLDRWEVRAGRNQTKVGLKGDGEVMCGVHGERRNQTKVGLKDQRPTIAVHLKFDVHVDVQVI